MALTDIMRDNPEAMETLYTMALERPQLVTTPEFTEMLRGELVALGGKAELADEAVQFLRAVIKKNNGIQ